jgi:hypothetical protein
MLVKEYVDKKERDYTYSDKTNARIEQYLLFLSSLQPQYWVDKQVNQCCECIADVLARQFEERFDDISDTFVFYLN